MRLNNQVKCHADSFPCRAGGLGLLLLVTALFLAPLKSNAQDWTQFRGPNGNGVLETVKHPLEWSGSKNVAWSVDISGGGWSSPIVVGDKVLVSNSAGPTKPVGFMAGVRNMQSTKPASELTFEVICFSLKDGSKLWSKPLSSEMPKYGIHPSNSFATSTPVSDGEKIFVYFASTGVVACLDLAGEEIWRKNVGAYPTGNGFGPGSSLAIHGKNVFVQCDNDEKSFIVALNKENGDEAWRKKRESRTSWSTPFVWKNKSRTELIVCGSGFVTSYNPEDGEEFWTVTNVDSAFTGSPAADSEKIYFGNSGPTSNGPLLSIDSTVAGKHTFQQESPFSGLAWSQMQSGPGMASPVCVGDYVYVTSRGIISCYSAKDGKRVYRSRINGIKSAVASLWGDKERIFVLDEEGQTFVLATGPEYKLLGTNKLTGLFWSTPSVAGESLLLRGADKLFCIRGDSK